ncbi:hypothetical protein ACEN30_00545 [Marinilactibacillus psychrotolerans]|uniref:hypothetical protein n=1 Tax=Marinilactibacillus psychrotolerans TaxID=191770 RepID=UPI0038866D94
MEKTYYTVFQVPVRVEWECPLCGVEDEKEWESFLEDKDEKDIWCDSIKEKIVCDFCFGEYEIDNVVFD